MTLNLSQFQDFLAKESPHRFLVSSENQHQEPEAANISYVLTFDRIAVIPHVNTVSFSIGESVLCFDRVTEVYVRDKKSMLGWIISLRYKTFPENSIHNFIVVAA